MRLADASRRSCGEKRAGVVGIEAQPQAAAGSRGTGWRTAFRGRAHLPAFAVSGSWGRGRMVRLPPGAPGSRRAPGGGVARKASGGPGGRWPCSRAGHPGHAEPPCGISEKFDKIR